MPLIQDLKNPAMRDRHWAQIKSEVQKPFDHNGRSSLLIIGLVSRALTEFQAKQTILIIDKCQLINNFHLSNLGFKQNFF